MCYTVYSERNAKGGLLHKMFKFRKVVLIMNELLKVDYKDVKSKILGFSSTLLLGIEDFSNTGIVYVFEFPSKLLKTDNDLIDLLFGSVYTDGHFRPKKAVFNSLMRYYSDYIRTDIFYTKTTINAIAESHNVNCGYALEILLENDGLKKATIKQDKHQKIDLTENGKRIQVKCAMLSSKKAYSITNGSVN